MIAVMYKYYNKILNHIFNPALTIHKLRLKFSEEYADRYAIQEWWKSCMGYEIDLDNPVTFNEKLQWLKLYDRNPLYTTLADKYRMKNWIAENIGEEYVIPTLGVYQKFEQIDFEKLPNRFVLKCNHDCGSVVVCKDKKTFDVESARKKIEEHLKFDFFFSSREWCYKDIPRLILCEKYMQNGDDENITDYKFFCFNGVVKFLYVSNGMSNWDEAYMNYMMLDWELAPFQNSEFKTFPQIPQRPAKFNEMIELAKRISKDFTFVRVDLYVINDQIYVSELTFYPGAGINKYVPNVWDRKIGELLTLPPKKNI